MTKQITDYVLRCEICNRYRDSSSKEPLHSHDIPNRPWQNISCDLFSWNNQNLMVTVDAYSRYFEIDNLPNMTNKTVIRKLKMHFSRFGFPNTLKTDNGSYFISDEFQKFLKTCNIRHETSSPTHASSNGLAEVYVKIAKRILQKAKYDNRDPYVPLLEHRNTPLKSGYSPAHLLMGRRLRSILPATNKQLMLNAVDHRAARQNMKEQQIKTKINYDKTTRKLPPLNIGQHVTVQRDKLWEPAKIISKHNDHSYKLQTRDGSVYRRNRIYINDSKPRVYPDHNNPTVNEHIHPSLISDTASGKPQIQSQNLPKSEENSNHCETSKSVIRTRSGREVKPSKLYSGEEWTK